MKNFSFQWKKLSSSPPSFNPHLLKFNFLFLTLLFGVTIQSFAQQRTISGRVTSQNTGVPNVTVQVKGTSTAT
ncbi:MAG: hypothetical protein H0U39_07715, partial [Segetibacter sp.]|nr:hypothetical protein [Segetibacter sp.]